MLRLNRQRGQRIEITHKGETLVLSVERIAAADDETRAEVQLGFEAPESFDIWREEVGKRGGDDE